jgi:hypothetical protein
MNITRNIDVSKHLTPFLVPILVETQHEGLEVDGTSPDYKPVIMRENWNSVIVI